MSWKEKSLPNLILIDGGRGHLSSVEKIICELDLSQEVDIACVAKGRFRNNIETDEVYLLGKKGSIFFQENSPSRFLLQRIRDESHRFAISYHRKLRDKSTLASPLESIPGIGKKRRIILLKKFGSLEAIREASTDQLQNLPGITESLAQKILATLGSE